MSWTIISPEQMQEIVEAITAKSLKIFSKQSYVSSLEARISELESKNTELEEKYEDLNYRLIVLENKETGPVTVDPIEEQEEDF